MKSKNKQKANGRMRQEGGREWSTLSQEWALLGRRCRATWLRGARSLVLLGNVVFLSSASLPRFLGCLGTFSFVCVTEVLSMQWALQVGYKNA